ncbi:MAG: hypothetical protein A2928_02410 [Candidatus Taylorbacteria bacterium RIFCSPLOWO2_01_FULL_45_15b]|uniref:Uncharacterized protein n=1 Tax=Candidatus Taylorbacteria bacterium RIFCSPLOWO2_01_FULL_45_15b TaxID=1802319 RepID=A0A1G2NHJ1_9BACT|nr:MAG: hypothetical protein A2928_02410 [Candidatus Taylorbacteria bacterium RIFCSPLOWO2_01_FULL_45_15b]
MPENLRLVHHYADALDGSTAKALCLFEPKKAGTRLGVPHAAAILDVNCKVVSQRYIAEVGYPIVGEEACSRLAVEHYFIHSSGKRKVGALRDNDKGDSPVTLSHFPDFLEKREESFDSGFVAGKCDCSLRLPVKKFFKSGACVVRCYCRHGKPLLS